MSIPSKVRASIRPDRKRSESAEDRAEREGVRSRLLVAVAALGIVYGDLGTSAIYALHAVFTGGSHLLAPSSVNILGVLSLVFWTLIVVVSLKYMTFVLRADNRGEGGTFALIALLRPWQRLEQRTRMALVLLGLAGASMLYAGVMITPAISILSAVEGLEIAAPDMAHLVIPVTLAIIVLLFAVQRFGTHRVGIAFGPIMTLWFLAIAALGVYGILQQPAVIAALNPVHAVAFFRHNGAAGFLILFAVFLVTTGAEALYADIGHFGRRTIRWMWFVFVLPALVLNYFGQGAMLLQDPHAGTQPFFFLVPHPLLYPMVVLATLATIIASQAAISGAFSLTRQAGRLGMLPRARVVQTSTESAGQIYVPFVNWMLMAAAVILVVLFRNSDALASTYGISVSTAMVVTTVLAFFVARERGHWPAWAAVGLLVPLLAVDLAFFGSNLLRIPYGGWFPIIVGLLFFTVMSTWRRGGELLAREGDKDAQLMEDLMAEVREGKVARVPGTAVFLTLRRKHAPAALSRHIERNRALQEQVVMLTVLREDVPRTGADERLELEDLGGGFFRVVLHYGYLQQPNIPSELATLKERGIDLQLKDATYYVAHPAPISGNARRDGMVAWRDHLLGFLVRNSLHATDDYQLPADQVIDMGLRMRI